MSVLVCLILSDRNSLDINIMEEVSWFLINVSPLHSVFTQQQPGFVSEISKRY